MVVKCSCAGGELDGSDSSPLLGNCVSAWLAAAVLESTLVTKRGLSEWTKFDWVNFMSIVKHQETKISKFILHARFKKNMSTIESRNFWKQTKDEFLRLYSNVLQHFMLNNDQNQSFSKADHVFRGYPGSYSRPFSLPLAMWKIVRGTTWYT